MLITNETEMRPLSKSRQSIYSKEHIIYVYIITIVVVHNSYNHTITQFVF